MAARFAWFRIVDLHGYKTYEIRFVDNSLILVGENGSGKTTVLRMLFYFLSGRWQSLVEFQFTSVTAEIDGQRFSVERDALIKTFKLHRVPFARRFPIQIRDQVRQLIMHGVTGDRLLTEVRAIANRNGYSALSLEREVMQFLEDDPAGFGPSTQIRQSMQAVQERMNAQILYLPTYRRIERELSSIFENPDAEELRQSRQKQPQTGKSYIELVEFGMKDVQGAVERSVGSIRDFARENLNRLTLRYLSDVVDKAYLQVDMSEIPALPPTTVKTIIDRIDDSILSRESKEHLSQAISALYAKTGNMTDHDRLVYHYFSTILHFQERLQQREQQISEFCELCSQYIVDKAFIYNSSKFTFSIVSKDDSNSGTIELADLSSGEKQIVSLFSHVYLSEASRFFVLIDEPELSLSVPWQRRFLEDIYAGAFCAGIVAVTHSPFIYDNSLRRYAHSIDEFRILPGRLLP